MNVYSFDEMRGITKLRLVLLLALMVGSILVSLDLISSYLPYGNPNYPIRFQFQIYYTGHWNGSFAGWSGVNQIENRTISGTGNKQIFCTLIDNLSSGIMFSVTVQKVDNSSSQLSLYLYGNFANTTLPFGMVNLQEEVIS